jgi:glycopeptide antibiotics resistance protein
MVPVGGVGSMLVGAAISGLFFWLVALGLRRSVGTFSAYAIAGFGWSLVVIALVTLLPAYGDPGIVPAEGRATACSTDIGGPAPEGFWVFAGGQRLLNTVLFIPSGVLLVLAVARWRIGWVLVPLGLAGLVGYSVAIELTQLELARLDRACDLTDVVDNVVGAVLGVGIGLVLILAFRPWRHRQRTYAEPY